jgi:hypothetical protein
MSNPILIIRIPGIEDSTEKNNIVNQLLELQKKITDYHILPVMENNIHKVTFEVLSPKEVDEKYLEDLKKSITEIFINNLEQ